MRWHCPVPLPDLADERVPGRVLLGEDATGLFAAALAPVGGEVREVQPRQVTYEPGHSLTVRYDVEVRARGGTVTDEVLVARSGAVPGALHLEGGGHTISVWRVPHDPALPGLASALDPVTLGRLLTALGVESDRAIPHLYAYRPGRRAVVEVEGPTARIFLKVVRPQRAAALHEHHVHLAEHVPVPVSLGWDASLGVVALQALPGRTLRTVLGEGGAGPDAGVLVGLLDRLPDPASAPPGSLPSWQARRFAGIIGTTVPDVADDAGALAAALADAEARAAIAEPTAGVHGDFHEAQVLVDGDVLTGLLDVDTFGAGRRVDDLATMIGHLSTLASMSPRYGAADAYAQRLLQAFDELVDPARLREATAAVVLGLATGPFRVLERRWPENTRRRVALARSWLAHASAGHAAAPAAR